MSFSQEVKNELIEIEYEEFCCIRSRLYGMCLFGKSFTADSVSLQTENEKIAKHYEELLNSVCHVKADFAVSPKGRSYTVSVKNENDCAKIRKIFSHDSVGSLRVDHSNFDCENCRNAFIAGAFLSCGTVSSPKKDYHMEFTVPYMNLAKSFETLLKECETSPKITNRKGYHIIYFKESEAIEDCLYYMGASVAMFEMMNTKIEKDIRNSANRKANCETANIERMVQALVTQLDAIDKIKKKKGLNFLSKELQSMADLRLENPDSSLQELAEISGLSRSGVNHRLKRIVEIAKDL